MLQASTLFPFLLPTALTCCKAPNLLCDGDLSGSLRMNQAAQPSDDLTELCDHASDSLTRNIMKCEYIDIFDNDNSITNEIDSLILLHVNIRTLNKRFNDLHNLIASLPYKSDVRLYFYWNLEVINPLKISK